MTRQGACNRRGSLTTRKTHTLGLLLPTIANPFYPEVALPLFLISVISRSAIFP
ncbi:MAG TPA: hypothetical protein VNL71_09070 [Chloroflexota bacterium]|nr:hypothetical protein [Chloroflexota bacterium]